MESEGNHIKPTTIPNNHNTPQAMETQLKSQDGAALTLWKASSPFVLGGLSGMWATCCIQPIDMVKVRIQLYPTARGPLAVAAEILKNEGISGFYEGLSAGLLRQAIYTTARLGFFRTFCDQMGAKEEPLPFYKKAIAGLAAGGISAAIATPADLALIRMQADGMLPANQRAHYTSVYNALTRIAKEEGIAQLWSGNMPTVTRAMALNCGMLATYDQSKEILRGYTSSAPIIQFGSSAIAGFFASACSLPFDFVKTRMQKQRKGPDGSLAYSSSLDCAKKVIQQEGPFTFYRGFLTYYVRIAPHAMITLLTLEQLNKFSKRYIEGGK